MIIIINIIQRINYIFKNNYNVIKLILINNTNILIIIKHVIKEHHKLDKDYLN